MSDAPKLVVICGLSFAGKTTLAAEIAKRFAYQEVDVDKTKVALYHVAFEANDLDQRSWDHIYEETDRRIERLLQAGTSVIDASRNFRRRERDGARSIAARCRAAVLTVYVDTPEAVARRRLLANRVNPTRVGWSDEDFDDVVKAMEPPTADEHPLVFHYRDDVAAWIQAHGDDLTP
jgi:predicted kinase